MAEATLRKFISVVPSDDGKATGAFAANTSVNRIGHAVTSIGKNFLQVNELIKFQNEWILGIKDKELERIDEQYKKEKDQEKEDIEKKKKRTGREQDKTASKLQTEGKDLAKKLYKKEGKKKKTGFGWAESLLKALSPIFAPLKWFVQTVITYAVFKWIGDPQNKEKIDKFVKFISALGKFAWWLTSNSIGNLMDGVTKVFTWDPTKSKLENIFDTMVGGLQILGGLAGLWAVSRLLMPWKIVGDVKAMAALGAAVTAAEATGGGRPRGPKGPDGKPKGPDGKPKFDPKDVKARNQKWKKIRRQKYLKQLSDNVTRARKGIVEGTQTVVKKTTETIKKVDPKLVKEQTENLVKGAAKTIDNKAVKPFQEVVTNVVEQVKNKPIEGKKPNPGMWESLGKWVRETAVPKTRDALVYAKDKTVEGVKWTGKFMWDKVIVPTMKQLDELGGWVMKHYRKLEDGIKSAPGKLYDMGANIGQKLKDAKDLLTDPKKLMEVITDKMKPMIDGAIESNPLTKKLNNLTKDPKALSTVFDNIKNNDIFKQWKTLVSDAPGVNKAKVAGNLGVGPLDILIDAAFAVFDYAYAGESPLNVISKALGSFIGYGVGFTAASLIPGAQGWGSMLGGIAGAMLGEWAGIKVGDALAAASEKMEFPQKGGFYMWKDPLAKALLGDSEGPSDPRKKEGEENFLKPDFKERPVARHPDAGFFEFGNPNKKGDEKGKPYSEGGYVGHAPLASWAKGKDHKKPATKLPAYMSMMTDLVDQTPYRMEKMREKISLTEINTTTKMTELSERKIRRVKEMQMHTHVVAVTQPVIKTKVVQTPAPQVHYGSNGPHIHMFK